jgi:ABC-type transporter Mla subunit MlaD
MEASMIKHQHDIQDVNHLREELDDNKSGITEIASTTSQTLAQLLSVIENTRKLLDDLEERVAQLEKMTRVEV